MLTTARLFSDGRNQPRSNYAPRTLGSAASKLLKIIARPEYGATPHDQEVVRLWIDSGVAYPGTYAALGCGMIGNYAENNEINMGADWPATKSASAAIAGRCAGCHNTPERLLPLNLGDERGVSFWQPSLEDPRLLTSRHIVFNLSRPEKSLMLLAPLSAAAGGWGLCKDPKTHQPATIFRDKADPGYRDILAMIDAGKHYLETVSPRFDMPNFRPRVDWVREMKRYGVLPGDAGVESPLNCYEVERRYWESLWYRPPVTLSVK